MAKAKGKLEKIPSKIQRTKKYDFEYAVGKTVTVRLNKEHKAQAKGNLSHLNLKKVYTVYRNKNGRVVSKEKLGKQKVKLEIWRYNRTLKRSRRLYDAKRYIKRKKDISLERKQILVRNAYKNIRVQTVVIQGEVFVLTNS